MADEEETVEQADDGVKLANQTLSTNPCPICEAAADEDPMTFEEWADSEYGLPGSDARYCGGACHCILGPEDVLAMFPALDNLVKLRGDEGSELGPVIEVTPNEKGLAEAMDEYNATVGQLPPEVYSMPLADIEAYLRRLLAGGK